MCYDIYVLCCLCVCCASVCVCCASVCAVFLRADSFLCYVVGVLGCLRAVLFMCVLCLCMCVLCLCMQCCYALYCVCVVLFMCVLCLCMCLFVYVLCLFMLRAVFFDMLSSDVLSSGNSVYTTCLYLLYSIYEALYCIHSMPLSSISIFCIACMKLSL